MMHHFESDVEAHVEDDIRSGGFPEIEGLVSKRLDKECSVQFDREQGTLLIATNDTQILLDVKATSALANFLADEQHSLYAALLKELYSKYV